MAWPPGVPRVRSEREIREELAKLRNVRGWTQSDRVWRACNARERVLLWVLGESEDAPGERLLPTPSDLDRAAANRRAVEMEVEVVVVQGADRGPDPTSTGK